MWNVKQGCCVKKLMQSTASGPKFAVTSIACMPSSISVVASGYGDDSIRIWDLDTQYCMQIVMGHHSEIWSLDVDPQERLLVTGSANQELRVYHIHLDKHEEPSTALDAKIADLENIENDTVRQSKWEVLIYTGDIKRLNISRISPFLLP